MATRRSSPEVFIFTLLLCCAPWSFSEFRSSGGCAVGSGGCGTGAGSIGGSRGGAMLVSASRFVDMCEPISIEMCKGIGYNLTKMPNLFGDETQLAAESRIKDFVPLIDVNCSDQLKFFLCSMFAPWCTKLFDSLLIVPVCRHICVQVRQKCEGFMLHLDFEWPAMLDCNQLPETPTGDEPCISDDATDDGLKSPPRRNPDTKIYTERSPIRDNTVLHRNRNNKPKRNVCPKRFVQVDSSSSGNKSCALGCGVDVFFTQKDKDFAEVWMMIWASFCFVSTLLTVATFAVDSARFQYTERPVIFLSMCFFIQSIAYIIRFFLGPDAISCDSRPDGVRFLFQEGLQGHLCIVIFLMIYYFGMAASIWWVILTFTWFLAAGRKWGQEAIQMYSSLFHLAAWTIPAIKTIIILAMGNVDGDEYTGLCYVGCQDITARTVFVLVPLIVYLVLGVFFILAGFIAMMRIRKDLKQDQGNLNIRKLEKLMAKMCVFSVLYTVPAVCVIGCHFYEEINYSHWLHQIETTPCFETSSSSSSKSSPGACSLESSIPSKQMFIVKMSMSLAVGVISGMWIWNQKTLNTWKKFCSRRFGKRKPVNFNTDYHPAPIIQAKSSHQTSIGKLSNGHGVTYHHPANKVIASRI